MGERVEACNLVSLDATKKRPIWQPGFFDHILRNDESYSENPVRAGLVQRADDWPYHGEFVVIGRANVEGPPSNVQFSIQNHDAESLSAIGRSVFDVGCSAFPC